VHYKYTVREWRQNVLQNLLPFGNNLKRLLHLSLSLLTDGLQKVLLSRDKGREREMERDFHRQSLERRGRFCGAGRVKIVERELVHA